MGLARCFEDLEIWQLARVLVKAVYSEFSSCKDFGFRDQIQRAAISVMNNIAEGFERRSKKEFAHSLDVAKGSCGEVRSMMYAAEDLKYLDRDRSIRLREGCTDLSKGIAALSRHLRKV